MIREGRIRKNITVEYRFGHCWPIKTVDRPVGKALVPEKFIAIWEAMLRQINYDGICCVNYKVEEGLPKVLEINPRVGGSLCEYLFAFIDKL